MASPIIYGLHENPIIAAISDQASLVEALTTNVEIIFLLKCNILELSSTVEQVKKSKKMIFVHADLVDGLSKDTNGMNYIIDVVKPDGIISTKSHLVKLAKSKGLMAIQRLFLLDSLSLQSGIESIRACNPDAVEILPGVMPNVTRRIVKATNKPVITGGLIQTKDDVISSLQAGAIGISTSMKKIWQM